MLPDGSAKSQRVSLLIDRRLQTMLRKTLGPHYQGLQNAIDTSTKGTTLKKFLNGDAAKEVSISHLTLPCID